MATFIYVVCGLVVAGAARPGPVLTSWLAGTQSAQTQTKTAGARLSGRVSAADTGKPLRGALVHILNLNAANPTERQGRWVTTDADGRWASAADLTAGRYTVSASKSGYLKLEYGQQRPYERGKTLDLADGQALEKLDLALPRSGAISGTISDEFGDPVTAAMVRVLRHRYVDGHRRLTPLAEDIEVLLNGGGSLTDDLGHFRVYGLAPGDYYVSAVFVPRGESATGTGYPPSYYPGTASAAEARRISLRLGEQAQNVNFNVVTARYARLGGTVINSANAPVRGSISLIAKDATATPHGGHALAGADGSFTISNVSPGEYTLQVWHGNPSGGVPEFASVPITVTGEDVTGLVLMTTPGATASGRVIFEGEPRRNTRLFVRSTTTAPGTPTLANSSTGVRPDMTFEIAGLAGRQTFRIGMLPESWFLKSITHDGVDITDSGYEFKPGQRISGVEIMLTQQATTLAGTVTDSRGARVSDYTVVAFSADSSKWGYQTRFVRSARPDQDGRFTIRALPPDDYIVAALEYVETGQELDPEQLENWRSLGTKITLTEGISTSVPLKLTR